MCIMCTHLNYKSGQFSNSEIGVTQSQKSVIFHILHLKSGFRDDYTVKLGDKELFGHPKIVP